MVNVHSGFYFAPRLVIWLWFRIQVQESFLLMYHYIYKIKSDWGLFREKGPDDFSQIIVDVCWIISVSISLSFRMALGFIESFIFLFSRFWTLLVYMRKSSFFSLNFDLQINDLTISTAHRDRQLCTALKVILYLLITELSINYQVTCLWG